MKGPKEADDLALLFLVVDVLALVTSAQGRGTVFTIDRIDLMANSWTQFANNQLY